MIANEFDTVFMNGDLTQLMIQKKGGRNKVAKQLQYPLYKLLKAFLVNYNIHIGGSVELGDYEVLAVTITPEFDLANELILKELYSFTNGKVNIQLAFRRGAEDVGAYAFWYDVADYSCVFEKYMYGKTVETTRYETLKEMLEVLKRENQS